MCTLPNPKVSMGSWGWLN